MILNTFAVLTALVGALRLAFGLLVVALGYTAWRAARRAATPEDRQILEDRCYLVLLLALLLVGLNVASWPLFYLLLQSYVPQWPGVMCIYGVLDIGADSMGPGRYLPDLLLLLQWTKPLLVFVGGAWFVLYLVNRQTQTGPLLARLFAFLIPLGALAAADALAELAYIVIPKKEEFPSGGCCIAPLHGGVAEWYSSQAWSAWLGPSGPTFAYVSANLGLLLCSYTFSRKAASPPGKLGLLGLLVGGTGVALVNGLFLAEVAAPRLLGLPCHRCVYDLIPQAPEAILAAAFFVGGFFCLGWACVARWCGDSAESAALLPGTVQLLLRLSFWGIAAAFVMLSLELALT
ncbi:MAG: hypothetical protein L0215_16685 [Gemmataceae bacterium]|nr:hypothetical protein [Gemmataceae bacterium]